MLVEKKQMAKIQLMYGTIYVFFKSTLNSYYYI